MTEDQLRQIAEASFFRNASFCGSVTIKAYSRVKLATAGLPDKLRAYTKRLKSII